MKYPRKWEDITKDQYAGCARLKIHGGWLVVSWSTSSANENLLFIQDPNHEWELEHGVTRQKASPERMNSKGREGT